MMSGDLPLSLKIMVYNFVQKLGLRKVILGVACVDIECKTAGKLRGAIFRVERL